MQLKIKKLRPTATIPTRATPGSAGLDLYADLGGDIHWGIDGECRKVIPCGISIEIPPGYEGQIRPRSGLAAKHGITVLNSPGTVDSDYRGEIKVILVNHDSWHHNIEHGQRIAQLVISSVAMPEIVEVDELDDTDRGQGGFGSTGI